MNLKYMETAVLEKIKDVPGPTLEQREKAHKDAVRNVAGFEVFDEKAERQALDRICEENSKVVNQYRSDADQLTTMLAERGITPLAVLPDQAFRTICRDAGLFRLNPDHRGQVALHIDAFDHFRQFKGRQLDSELNRAEQLDWPAMLKRCFPTGDSADNASSWRNVMATVVLPPPPADAVEVLVKAQGLELATTAVPEAIRFQESLVSLYRRDQYKREERRKYEEWLKNDPMVTTTHGYATAVIVQFGDFPIEKAIIDSIVRTKKLLGDLIEKGIGTAGLFTESIKREMERHIAMIPSVDIAEEQYRRLRARQMQDALLLNPQKYPGY